MAFSIADTIKDRRTIHRFKSREKPSMEMIQMALEHATWAPNHQMTQPWHFYLIGSETAERICQLNAELVRVKQGDKVAGMKLRRWREIPGWLLLSCDKGGDDCRNEEDYAACCCAAQNLSLYLWEKGVGMKWTTGTVTRDQRIYDIMRIDRERQKIVGLFWYGYPEDIPQKTRRPLDESLIILP